MRIYILEQENLVPCPLDQAFAFFGNPYNLNKITPPWLDFSILYAPQEIYRGCILYYRLKLHGVPITWVTQIVEWDPTPAICGYSADRPVSALASPARIRARGKWDAYPDVVNYALPLGWLGRLAHRLFVRPRLRTYLCLSPGNAGSVTGRN
jgi:ligand-binding SRPBCC domain-containing protein